MLKRTMLPLAAVISLCAVVAAQQSPHGGPGTPPQPGPNVNAAGGIVGNPTDSTALVRSDILLQRQNETVAAASTKNPDHILYTANDYRFVDFPNDPYFGEDTGQTNAFARLIAKLFTRPGKHGIPSRAAAGAGAWTGVYRSCDGGASFIGSAVPGSLLDVSPASMRSPLRGLSTSAPVGAHAETTDPVLAAGPGGRMHLVVLGFLRWDDGHVSDSRMYYSSYTDRNNHEGGPCFNFDFQTEIDRGSRYATSWTPSPFIDKPSMAVDKDGTLYVSYTVFTDSVKSKVVIARSTNGGATWSRTIPLLNLGFLRNHGTTMAVDPLNGAVYVAWRLFYQNWPLMVISRSYDKGRTFFPATPISNWWPARTLDQIVQQLKAARLQPFDQFTNEQGSPATARALAFPNIVAGVVNGRTKLFAVWQERADVNPLSPTFGQPLAAGSPRIMLSMSSDGGWSWTPRRAVDAGLRAADPLQPTIDPERPSGPQLQPVLSISGTTNPQLLLLYYEARGEIDPVTTYVSGNDRQIDVRVARLDPVTGNVLAPSAQVSQYAIKANTDPVELAERAPGAPAVNLGNLTMYGGGRFAFMGDYPMLAPATTFEYNGGWKWATEPSPALAMWTDSRDVQFPLNSAALPDINADWAKYTPVKPFGPAPIDCTQVASRNSNPYLAQIAGVVAGSPQTFKPLTIQRAFVTYVANRTTEDRWFRLTLVPQTGIVASFDQFASNTTDDVQIFMNSSHTRSVWVQPNLPNPTGSVRMRVQEIDGPNGQLKAGGYRTSLTLNPDPNNDALTPIPTQAPVPPGTDTRIDVTELHNPQVSAPQVSAFNIKTPQVSAPQVSAPQVSAPQVSAPQVSAPQVSAPQVSAPQVSAPQVSATAPGEPPNGTDVTYTVTNTGNTDSTYNALLNVPNVQQLINSGSYDFQVLITRTSLVPGFVLQTGTGCVPAAETKVQVISNLQIPQVSAPQISAIDNPQISAPQISAIATFSVAPEGGASVVPSSDDAQSTNIRDEVKVTVRAIRLKSVEEILAQGVPLFDPGAVVIRVVSASTNVLNGVVQGTAPEDAPSALAASTAVVTNSLDAGAGSLRQAILEANLQPDPNQIVFNIQNIEGPATVNLTSALPDITSPLSIDATTQPGYAGTPLIVLNGANIVSHGLHILGGGSTVRGLAIGNFAGDGILLETGGANVVEANYIGTDAFGTQAAGNGGNGIEVLNSPNNRIGGSSSATRNLVSANGGEGIKIGGVTSTANFVIGNYVGTNAAGALALGNSASGVYLRRAGHNTVLGNVVSGNTGFAGVAICGNPGFCGGGADAGQSADAAGNVLQGNIVGLTADGLSALANAGVGVSIDGTSDTIVGGTSAAERNIISGNGAEGVRIFNDATANIVRGNYIGTDVTGASQFGNGFAPGGYQVGVEILAGSNNVISGSEQDATGPNVIAFNAGWGIEVQTGTGNKLRINSIFSNDDGGPGIVLFEGANNSQPAPSFSSASLQAGVLTLQGTARGPVGTNVTVDFYLNPSCTTEGSSDGRQWFGSTTVAANSDGFAAFNAPFGGLAVAGGNGVTALATTEDGSTSQFSSCIAVAVPPGPVSYTFTGTVTAVDPAVADAFGVIVGMPMNGSFVFDPNTNGFLQGSETNGFSDYLHGITNIVMSVGGTNYTATAPPFGTDIFDGVQVANNYFAVDRFVLSGRLNGSTFNEVQPLGFVSLDDTTLSSFFDTQLTHVGDLSNWTTLAGHTGTWYIAFSAGGGSPRMTGTITSISPQ